jgi:hypothetical protein
MKRTWKMFKALVVCGLLSAAVALPGTAQAAEIGQVCNLRYGEWVLTSPWGSPYYFLGTGAGFRITGFAEAFYRGHGNSDPEGYLIRDSINQGSCHW